MLIDKFAWSAFYKLLACLSTGLHCYLDCPHRVQNRACGAASKSWRLLHVITCHWPAAPSSMGRPSFLLRHDAWAITWAGSWQSILTWEGNVVGSWWRWRATRGWSGGAHTARGLARLISQTLASSSGFIQYQHTWQVLVICQHTFHICSHSDNSLAVS